MNNSTFTPTPPKDGKSWFLRIPEGELPNKVILTLLLDVGEENILSYMTDVRKISEFGEYIVYAGLYENEEIGIVFHGSGSFSISTAIEEMSYLSVKAMLRVGNSGGLADTVHVGEAVICDGTIREDRLMLDYVPAGYPAVADREMVEQQIRACKENDLVFHEGITLSVGTFFPGSGFPTARGVFDQTVLDRVHLWKKAGALTMDIETSTVLVMGRLFGIKSGAMLGIGNHATYNEGSYMPEHTTNQIALAALKTLARLKV